MNRIRRILNKARWGLYFLTLLLARVVYLFLWALYNLSGVRHIWEMAWPRKTNDPEYRKPPTLFLWVIGLYSALYGIAATHYEAALDRVENRMGALASQLSTTNEEAFKHLIGQIPRIQEMTTPPDPKLLWPPSVVASLLTEDRNPEILAWTRETVEIWKDKLAGMDLSGIDLSGARLLGANLSRARLRDANLSGAGLWRANLSGAWLRDIRNWREIKSIKDANLLGIEDAPEGFRGWALENGAVEMKKEAWKAYLKEKYPNRFDADSS